MENERAKKWLTHKLVESWSKGYDQGAIDVLDGLVAAVKAIPLDVTFTKNDLVNFISQARDRVAQMKTHIPGVAR